MKTRCLPSYCLFAAAAISGVEGLSSLPVPHHAVRQQLSPPPPAPPPAPLTTTTTIMTSRRDVFQSTKSACLGAFCGWILAPKFSLAATTDVQGRVTLPSDSAAPLETTTAALYITCRPDRPDNVPRAILEGSRGKAPPVLSARFENPSFPFEFALTEQDVTLEGTDQSWWQNEPLVVSARWDMDGVAATRSPEDLVGRGLFSSNNGSVVEIALGGRGAFGKFATTKK